MPGLNWLTARPIAHRGLHDAARGVIENTPSAFEAAIAGNYGIECDVQVSADGEAMVHHDDALGRLTDGGEPLANLDAATLKQVVFKATPDRMLTLAELCQQHISVNPDLPLKRLGRQVSRELEHAILACLEKNRAKRPQTARDLAAMLDRVAAAWTLDDAETWWSRFERGQPTRSHEAPTEGARPATGTVNGPSDGTIAPSFDRTVIYEPPGEAD